MRRSLYITFENIVSARYFKVKLILYLNYTIFISIICSNQWLSHKVTSWKCC